MPLPGKRIKAYKESKMKRIIIPVAIACTFMAAKAPDISSVDMLIDDKQYLDAFDILEKADPDEKDVAITIKKTMLCLDYFAKSIGHGVFSLENLKHNETLSQIRRSTGKFEIVTFSPEKALKALIEKYPARYELHETLGIYYYEVYTHYSENSTEKQNETNIGLAKHYIGIALKNNCATARSFYIMGFINLDDGYYKEAIRYFNSSLERNNENPQCHYNLAFAYMKNKDYKAAMRHAAVALEKYTDLELKKDAAYFAHRMATGIQDRDRSMEYAVEYVRLEPRSHKTLKQIVENYYNTDYDSDVVRFFETIEGKYKNDDIALGNICLYRGIYYSDRKQKDRALIDFDRAEKIFQKIYPADHEVFKFINESRTR